MAMREEAQGEAKHADNEENDGEEDHLNGGKVKGKVENGEEDDRTEEDQAHGESVPRQGAAVDKVREERLNVVQQWT